MSKQTPMQLDKPASAPPAKTTDKNNLDRKPVLSEVQGDVILGLMKRTQIFTFFTIRKVDDFKKVLKTKIGPCITTHNDVVCDQDRANAANKYNKSEQTKVWLPIVQTNIAFAASGLRKLNPADGLPKDEAFLGGQVKDAKGPLQDPIGIDGSLSTWDDAFNRDDIDGVLNITAPDSDLLDKKLDGFLKDLGDSIRVITEVQGRARPGNQMGHEHFGFKDGVSVPVVKCVNDTKTNGPQDALDAGAILAQHPRIIPQFPDNLPFGGKDATAQTETLEPTWARDGSYMVFRQLQQKVPEFHLQAKVIADNAKDDNTTKELVETRMVGRWPSGAPLVETAQENLDIAKDAEKMNKFDFSNDLLQEKCPFVAHIRKTNPRSGTEAIDRVGGIHPRLMIRQGIPYGPETTRKERTSGKSEFDRGLCFVSYQSSIVERFRFVQNGWANNVKFPPLPTALQDKLPSGTGQDAIIGQAKPGEDMFSQNIVDLDEAGDASDKNRSRVAQLVIPRGGEYFFVPPKSALCGEGALVKGAKAG